MAEMAQMANNVDAVDANMIDVTDGGDIVVEDRRQIEHVGPPLGNDARYKVDPGTVTYIISGPFGYSNIAKKKTKRFT